MVSGPALQQLDADLMALMLGLFTGAPVEVGVCERAPLTSPGLFTCLRAFLRELTSVESNRIHCYDPAQP